MSEKGQALYDRIGADYAPVRRPDPRLARRVRAALGSASSVVNVGAGAGAYEPTDRWVAAVEPSRTMVRQRPSGAAPPVIGVAERLPLADRSVDAAMGVFTIHHWNDLAAGLVEMTRVARRRLVLVTVDPDALSRQWFVAEYAPEIMDEHAASMPALDRLTSLLPGAETSAWAVPANCTDLFFLALWARPELYLDPAVRAATSVWHQLSSEVATRSIERLRTDLESGRWDERHGELRARSDLDVGVRIVTLDLAGRS